MKCHMCGSTMTVTTTDLPFKVSQKTIVILKELPVMECDNCGEYLLEDGVMAAVDEILERIDNAAELEVIKYAA